MMLTEQQQQQRLDMMMAAAIAVLIVRAEKAYHEAQHRYVGRLDDLALRSEVRALGLDWRLMASRPHGRALPAWITTKIAEA